MTDDKNQDESKGKLNDDQTAAIVGALVIINFFAVYWALEIQSVRELLELAYG